MPWTAPEARRASTVQIGADSAEIGAALHAASREGRAPDRPFLITVQPGVADPTRAPAGRGAPHDHVLRTAPASSSPTRWPDSPAHTRTSWPTTPRPRTHRPAHRTDTDRRSPLRRRFATRTPARRIRRYGHARCRLPREALRLSAQPADLPGLPRGGRAERRAAHREELHGGPDQLGIAAERLADAGIACGRVLVDDDLASDSEEIAAGRRGTGATVLVEKVPGGAADTGMGLDGLGELGTTVANRCRTLAVASAAHHVPVTGERAFELPPANWSTASVSTANAPTALEPETVGVRVEDMAGALLDALRPGPDDPLIALVNGLGSVTSLELYGIFEELGRVLDTRRVRLARHLVAHVTALDVPGFSTTLMVADPRPASRRSRRRWRRVTRKGCDELSCTCRSRRPRRPVRCRGAGVSGWK
ncbi:hypothetical protein SHIRM173S_00580 [Streptomyces hirsutus]